MGILVIFDIMEREKIKDEINDLLSDSPDVVLVEILDYLNTIKNRNANFVGLSQNLRKILYEDKELLEKLAQ